MKNQNTIMAGSWNLECTFHFMDRLIVITQKTSSLSSPLKTRKL
jgi:hypothetical protein